MKNTMETITVKTVKTIQYCDMYNCTYIIPKDTQVEVESTIYKDLNGDEYYRTVSVLFPLTRLWKSEVRTSL